MLLSPTALSGKQRAMDWLNRLASRSHRSIVLSLNSRSCAASDAFYSLLAGVDLGLGSHYRNRKLCRVPSTLPSFFLSRALGKGCICRVPKLEHSTTTRSSAKLVFAECSVLALGKDVLFTECSDIPIGKDFLCRVSTSHTRQILSRR